MTTDIKITDKITGDLKRISQGLKSIPAAAFNVFVKATPIDTGNARSRTRLENNNTIQARYPYAQRLNEGWSKQSPSGMVEPTEKFIKSELTKLLRKK